jgi:hypothetical protein
MNWLLIGSLQLMNVRIFESCLSKRLSVIIVGIAGFFNVDD